MNKVVWSAFLLATAGIASSIQPALAQTSSVSLDCGGSDVCFADVTSPGSPTPYKFSWSFDNTAGVLFPGICTEVCQFYCPSTSKTLTATVNVTDANNQFIGSATARARCTPEPL